MQGVDLLSMVQPVEGWFAVLGIKGVRDVKQQLVATREEVDELVARYTTEERNVFFGVAKYETDQNRTKDNVKALRAFWMDIDCGEAKAVPNSKTGRPDGYIDQAAGLKALQVFCSTLSLPRPTLVDSGRGLHAYWSLTQDIPRSDWERVAAKLAQLCHERGFYVDRAVFEAARIMRVPGTLNFKDDPPKPVRLLYAAEPVELQVLEELLGIKPAAPVEASLFPRAGPKRVSKLAEKMRNDSIFLFSKILQRSKDGTGCKQILACYEERSDLPEIRWFDALSIAKFCEDGTDAIHTLSEGHPDYDPQRTLDKTRHITGPHNCVTFERNNPSGCYGCPYFGKIKNPIVLGREIEVATAEDGSYVTESDVPRELRIPEFPAPFVRGKNGGVYKLPSKDDEVQDPMLVYPHDLYVVKLMTDPKDGEMIVMRLHLPKEGIREFVISMKNAIGDPAELRKVLASKGVACFAKQFAVLCTYVITAIMELQNNRKAELMRLQFGWADNDTKFIVGDREITVDGVYHSPPSTTTSGLADRMIPMGSYEKWQEVFNLYGRSGLEPHAFAALTAFGAPLFKFTGQSGAILNVIHPKSGTGKTTILHMCNSVWGHPRDLCAVKEDTANAKAMHLGIMNNLPFTVDEMTNMTPQSFSEMAYNMSQGRGKNRMKASGNELRLNSTTWQTISLCSSNSSFYEKLALIKNNPDGEMMRLLEYKIDYNDAIPTDVAKHMFDHELMENYGHAGMIYIEWVLNNLTEVKNTLKVVQTKIDRELQLTQRERFWSAEVAANITGGMIARRLKIIDWDMKRIYQWATSTVKETRKDVEAPLEPHATVLGDYLNRHIDNILVVQDKADNRSNLQVSPRMEPRNELFIRFETDTNRLYVNYKHFREDCVLTQINFKELTKDLESRGIYLGANTKRLSKGMKISTPPVYAMEFDTTIGDFFDVSELFPAAESAVAG